ncbi:hypothetical protein H4R33_003481 [Dimargaris cristalligena]|nr:hypothetical protein H4R33_003481 [Dimargaris cristalligena]
MGPKTSPELGGGPHPRGVRHSKQDSTAFENQVVTMLKTAHTEDMLMPDVSRVLVIYTGGTIGMKNTDMGYVPVPNYLSQLLSKIDRFHDATHASNSITLSRNSSFHSLSDTSPPESSGPSQRGTPRLSPRGSSPGAMPIGDDADLNVEGGDNDSDVDEEPAEESVTFSPWLITPRSLYGKRIRYRVMEYSPLLDSCNMTMSQWIRIASDIEAHYCSFDAFIILHGTDTMAYTASALSFLLEDLGKTVILTGSQVPISEVRTDAIENLLGALTIAGHFVIPEVCLYFGNTLFRGNRTSKTDAMDFNAFESANMAPLVKVGVNIEVNWADVLRPTAISKFRAHKDMNPNVATLRLFPGITAAAIRAFLSPPIVGVVLETYGAGNAPNTRRDFFKELKAASDRGVVIVNCSQCKKGLVSDLYATSKHLMEAQVVPGRDMTAECALTKLSYLLGRQYSPEECRILMGKNLRGELTSVDPHHGVGFHNRVHHFLQFLATTMFSEPYLPTIRPHPGGHDGADEEAPSSTGNSSDISPMVTSLQQMNLIGESTPDVGGQNGPFMAHISTLEERLSIEKTFFPILICAAAAIDDLEGLRTLRQLLGGRFQLNCVDYDGRTPLHLAASEGRFRACEFLLTNGASVHVLDHFGHTPIFDAVRKRSLKCVQMLVQAGAMFNGTEQKDICFRFASAAIQGDINMLKLFVLAGIDVNKPNFDDRTALHLAAAAGQDASVAYLLSLPAINRESKDRWRRTPLEDTRQLYELMTTNRKPPTAHKLASMQMVIRLLEAPAVPRSD